MLMIDAIADPHSLRQVFPETSPIAPVPGFGATHIPGRHGGERQS